MSTTQTEDTTTEEPEPEPTLGPEPETARESGEDTPEKTESAFPRRIAASIGGRVPLPALLATIAVVLAGIGVWCTLESRAARSFDGTDNRAQLDTATTAQVTASVADSLNKIFSYSYSSTEVTEQAANSVLRGRALDTYHQLFSQVRQLAPQQKLVLTTRVVKSAVQNLTDRQAKLLVFLDQAATRADNDTASVAAAQLSVTTERQNDTWVITDLEPR